MRPLTTRELTCYRMLVDGLSDKEIARRMGVSDKTAKAHVRNIRRKLEVGNRTQVAIYANRVKNNRLSNALVHIRTRYPRDVELHEIIDAALHYEPLSSNECDSPGRQAAKQVSPRDGANDIHGDRQGVSTDT